MHFIQKTLVTVAKLLNSNSMGSDVQVEIKIKRHVLLTLDNTFRDYIIAINPKKQFLKKGARI